MGPGDIAERVMAPAMTAAAEAELVAVVGRDAGRTEAFAHRHGARRSYVDLAAFLADPEVEAVYVATPVDRHCEEVVAAAHAGLDVLCEKPLGRTADECRTMIEACRTAGVRLSTCFYQRYNVRHLEIRRLIAGGRIGQVTSLRINFSSRAPDNPGAWRQDPARSGGGSFIDTASHSIDLLRFLFGEVREVVALVDTLAAGYPVEDTASALLRLDGGIQAVITAHWSTDDPAESRSSVIEIAGTGGSIISWPMHEKFSRGSLVVATADGEERQDDWFASTHEAFLDDFARRRAAGEPPAITGDDGLATQRVVEAVYESSRTGSRVALA
jgi:predicted dehydrogenase